IRASTTRARTRRSPPTRCSGWASRRSSPRGCSSSSSGPRSSSPPRPPRGPACASRPRATASRSSACSSYSTRRLSTDGDARAGAACCSAERQLEGELVELHAEEALRAHHDADHGAVGPPLALGGELDGAGLGVLEERPQRALDQLA